jgi:hypothetical protein
MVSLERNYPVESPITEAPEGTLVAEMRVADEAREYELAVRTNNERMQYYHATQIMVILRELRDPQRESALPLERREAVAAGLEQTFGHIYSTVMTRRGQGSQKPKPQRESASSVPAEVHLAAA